MTLFVDLPRSLTLPHPQAGPPSARQSEVDALFPTVVSSSPLRLWAPGDPIPPEGKRLLIGVATWSAHDMALLDAVAEAVRVGSGLVVDVFNVADCASPAAFERYVPGIGNVFHAPVAGLWSGGRLVEKASGKAGRELIERVCGLEAFGAPAT
jgi:hypothetical protein